MDESISTYVNHYLKNIDCIIFLGLSLVVLIGILLLLYLYSAVKAGNRKGRDRRNYILDEFNRVSEGLYELIFSGGSILFFMAVYYLINRFMFIEPYRSFWDKHNDMLLLGLIVLSILVCRFMDNVLIRLKTISHDDKTALRLVGMVYMILIFCYIKFIYENDNYDMFISYFLGLMIGRFAYFDVSWNDIKSGISGTVRCFPLMLIALAYLAVLAWYGFKTGYLIKHIGVITNVFFIHIFMSVAIFIVFYIMKIFTCRRKRQTVKNNEN